MQSQKVKGKLEGKNWGGGTGWVRTSGLLGLETGRIWLWVEKNSEIIWRRPGPTEGYRANNVDAGDDDILLLSCYNAFNIIISSVVLGLQLLNCLIVVFQSVPF